MHQQITKSHIQAGTYADTKAVKPTDIRKRNSYFIWKRIMDVGLIVLALPLLIPLAAVVAILIKLDSNGPILFRQERVGTKRAQSQGGLIWEQRNFTLMKFRTMIPNASSDIHESFVKAYIAGDEAEMARIQNRSTATVKKYKLEADPRITRIGHWLRKTSLDELPQIWNVLIGDMSLVGPRPAIPYEVEMYETWHRQRFQTVQGLTGFWQTSGRNSISFDEMINLDIDYIEQQSVWFDLRILLLTLPIVLMRRGAE